MKNLNKIFIIAIKKMIKESIGKASEKDEFVMRYFKESDLKCYLVSLLLSGSQQKNYLSETQFNVYIDKDPRWGKKVGKCYAPMIHTELLVGKKIHIGKKLRPKNKFIDIAILKPNCVIFGTKKKYASEKYKNKRIFSYSVEKDEPNVYVQLKYSWGKPKDVVLREIKQDIDVLKYIHSKNKYVLYWDYGYKRISRTNITKFKSKYHTVIYINAITGDVFCNNKSLQNKIRILK